MKILVTGAGGFIGQNLTVELGRREGIEVLPFEQDTPMELLDEYCRDCDFVYNLAGVNRPEHVEEFMEGNFGFATTLVETLKKYGNICPVMNASSIQAALDNPYGLSKKAGEDMMLSYGREISIERQGRRYIFTVSLMCLESGAGPTIIAWWLRSAIILPMVCPYKSMTAAQ